MNEKYKTPEAMFTEKVNKFNELYSKPKENIFIGKSTDGHSLYITKKGNWVVDDGISCGYANGQGVEAIIEAMETRDPAVIQNIVDNIQEWYDREDGDELDEPNRKE